MVFDLREYVVPEIYAGHEVPNIYSNDALVSPLMATRVDDSHYQSPLDVMSLPSSFSLNLLISS